jgi:hypothetical protein
MRKACSLLLAGLGIVAGLCGGCGRGDAPDRSDLCVGTTFSYPRILELANDPHTLTRSEAGTVRRMLHSIYSVRFRDQAPRSAVRDAAVVVETAEASRRRRLTSREMATARAAFRRVERASRATCRAY